jgi:hypothetical protein
MQWLDFQLDQTQQQTFFLFLEFPIMWYSQTGDHQQEDLTKYGYRPRYEREKKKTISYLLDVVDF